MSVVLFGSQYLGKTDVVPGLFHVATKFWHVNYVPLGSMGSAVIFENSRHRAENGENCIIAVDIPFDRKSFFTAYLRLILWTAFLSATVFFLAELALIAGAGAPARMEGVSEHNLLSGSLLAAVLAGALLYWSYRASVASPERALELARLTGFSEELVLEQLAIGGYPFGSPARAFGVRKCQACGTQNHGMSREDGTVDCSHCGEPIAQNSEWPVPVVFVLGAVAFAVIAYYYRSPR
jgi:hypothetical protein